MLRSAFLSYVRALLLLQGNYLAYVTWRAVVRHSSSFDFPVLFLSYALIATLLDVTGLVTAARLHRGRRGTIVTAILIETLWALAMAFAGYEDHGSGTPVLGTRLLIGSMVLLVTIIGLLIFAARRPPRRHLAANAATPPDLVPK